MILGQWKWGAFSRNDLGEVRSSISNCLTDQNISVDMIEEIKLAADEAITNVLLHGYQEKPGYIAVKISLIKKQVVIDIEDNAPPFDINQYHFHRQSLSNDYLPVGGFGVQLIKTSVDHVNYLPIPGGNHLQLIKNI